MNTSRRLQPDERFSHTAWEIYNSTGDIKVNGHENGRVTIRRILNDKEEDVVENIPASLVFKMASMLRNTRRIIKKAP